MKEDRVPDLRERLAGAVWGHLVGDALGLPYELMPPAAVRTVRWGDTGPRPLPPGTWSDDGGLMLALLDSLLSVGFDTEDQGRRAVRWMDGPDYKPGPRFDVGARTQAAIERLKAGWPAESAGGAAEGDDTNGSLMRVLPVALTGIRLRPAEVVARACRASCVTHRHPHAQATCAVYCLIVRSIVLGEGDRARVLAGALADAELAATPEVRHALGLLRRYSQRAGTGQVCDTFWSAWDAFAASSSYAETAERAILYGADTDTVACVAGGMAGAYWGVSGIPGDWLTGMRGREIVDPLVARLLAYAAT